MHWVWILWFGYTWPSLKGNGPEAVVQTIVYGGIGYVFVPAFRKWVNNGFTGLHDKLDHVHAKLDHVITHSKDIPPFVHRDETGKFKKKP